MKITTIAHILDQHSVPYVVKDNRIYADSMLAFSAPFEETEDLTDYTHSQLYAWLGYYGTEGKDKEIDDSSLTSPGSPCKTSHLGGRFFAWCVREPNGFQIVSIAACNCRYCLSSFGDTPNRAL